MLAGQTVTAFKGETSIGGRLILGFVQGRVKSPLSQIRKMDEILDETEGRSGLKGGGIRG